MENINSLLSEVKSYSTIINSNNQKQKLRKKSDNLLVAKKSQKTARTLNNKDRIKRDDILDLEIVNTDDVLVVEIKKNINEKRITMDYIYKKVDELSINENAYNLFYGLCTHSTITWHRFNVWCDILDIQPILTLKNK